MTKSAAYRNIPSVNELVETPALAQRDAALPRSVIVACARQVLDEHRQQLAADASTPTPAIEQFAEQVLGRLDHDERPAMRPVINATGVILHTGLGRAPLADSAVQAARDAAAHYTSLEIDLETGRRGSRAGIVRDLLCELTGAEAATVVNNNAGATLIMLNTIAAGREVIVSRGELIEIGGSFRLPDIMQASSATLREVGTTNKTRLGDYAGAISDDTAALLKVHTSNYRVVGFTESVPIDELVALGRERDLPVIDDIGSGNLAKGDCPHFQGEPAAWGSIAAGADLVLFSGDKLLGGPQTGIIVGTRAWIERIERNPMMRALRVDKMTLAALEATLKLHRDPEQAVEQLPILAMANAPIETLRSRAQKMAAAIGDSAAVCETTAYLGGGSLPGAGMPSIAVRITPARISETELAARLREGDPPIVARVADGSVWLDLRTIFARQDTAVIDALKEQSTI